MKKKEYENYEYVEGNIVMHVFFGGFAAVLFKGLTEMVNIRESQLLRDFADCILFVGEQQLFCPLDPQSASETHGAFSTVLLEQTAKITVTDTALRGDFRDAQIAVLF